MISNADAGTADEESLEAALGILRAGASVELLATSGIEELDEGLAQAGDRTVVVAGGDGSLHAVVQSLHGRNDLAGRTLGLLPLGTGNDFARGSGVPLDIMEAAGLVLQGEARPVDLIVDDREQVVVNNVHAGAGAAASRVGARWKSRLGHVASVAPLPTGFTKGLGRLGYPIGALVTAVNPPTVRIRVTVDGNVVHDVDSEILMVAIGNGAHVGGGAAINPDADPESRVLDVVVTRALGPLARIGYAARLGRGTHTDHDEVLHVTGQSITVDGEAFWLSADGEIEGPMEHRTWRLVPAAYSLLLPR
ncbi:diacylglycerol kinase [Nocardioides cavernaquae]|uniref:Diacylglycerol kinase n=1 Tax=Nocardioides cavernaquae TaxID=2321396 RepID=A0A3A5HD11_9ACTN|nr:diacylglycerol kinase [Nocardioides cavernaquae]